MSNRLSEEAVLTILETADIGGTNTGAVGNWATYLDMKGFQRVTAVVELGTWNVGDDLDTCKFQQCTQAADAGGDAKDLTTSASGGNYDTDAPLDADGDQAILEARVEDLDVAGGFRYVRVYCAEAGNTGTDNISGVIVRHGAAEQYAERHVAASAGSKVYVTPES
ncbi:MAG TPA: hypothetical protein VM013_00435 [Dehalococcoidia bacterium]|nr:hypothetical protein [Dehalococcoidia bacterium]